MFAPQVIATSDWSLSPLAATYCFIAATPIAPAGSRMLRVSSNTSLIAAQTASVSTTTKSSTSARVRRNVSSPTCLTAVPSENRPTSSSVMRSPALTERIIASESAIWTPMTLISGRTALMYAATPEMRPPPPMATNTAWIGRWCWRRISMPTVPCPAITSGSSNGCTKVYPCRSCNRRAWR